MATWWMVYSESIMLVKCVTTVSPASSDGFLSSEAKYRVAHKLELVHGDLCGPVMPSTPSRNKYFILLVNDLSRYMWISLMGSKDQDLASFMAFKSRAKAKSKKKVGTLCTYHGGEFTKRTFVEHCMNEGIRGHLTAPYTP
jgi:hypothetical protein